MRFTIGIPAFKSTFIKECIDSVLRQTYTEFELIIINDASPEPIDEIIATYSDSRIRYFKNEVNTGAKDVVNNWNKCLALATGDYFVLMGDDDMMDAEYLSEFDRLINHFPELDIFHCRAQIINKDSIATTLTPSWPVYESVYDNIWHRIKGFRMQYISDFVYSTAKLRELGGFYFLPLAWGSDDISAYRQMAAKGIAHTNTPVLLYRNSPITLSNSGNVATKLLAIEAEKQWFADFIKNAQPAGLDIVLLAQIKQLLPQYFSSKVKLTLSLAMKKDFISGIDLSVKEIREKRATPKESISSALAVITEKFKKAAGLSRDSS
jgi:glycosyltransferase involved in cell wall biosynthesis